MMALTPVVVNTICTCKVRQGEEGSTNRLFRPLGNTQMRLYWLIEAL